MDVPADPYLGLPLHGVRLIEASAGTGKTFTLATLATRLVVERGLRVGQILAVTFTEAATQELRKRIRERLALAATLVPETSLGETALVGGTSVPTGFAEEASGLMALGHPESLPQDSPEIHLTRTLLAAHLATSGESPDALRRRLRQAADEIDLAAIFTIHGFCARVLREHALESGQTFAPPELLASDRELLEELAADLWRAHAAEAGEAEHLPALWPAGPAALARDLPALIRQPLLLPAPVDLAHDPRPALRQAAQRLAEAIAAHLEDARAAVAEAFERKRFDGRRARRPSFDKAFQALLDGLQAQAWSRGGTAHLDKLVPARLRELCKDGHEPPCSPLFDALDAWLQADDAMRLWQGQRRIALLHRLREEARERLAALKRLRRVQTYDDLIDDVAAALSGPHAEALAQRLRAQYAVALVDEFQDTDARQWSIFERVFGPDSPDERRECEHPATGHSPAALESARTSGSQARFLALIGDPKQAIYGFRGGDVHTYLAAAGQAERAPPLERNFRSRPSLLKAIAALYRQAGERAFVEEGIRFHDVQPGGVRGDDDFLRDGAPAPALTLWRAPPPAGDKPHDAERSRQLATAACVAAIHEVLAQARAGQASLRGRPVEPGDIAVLVRKHGEATRIQQALAEAGIPAVAAGKQSLFASEQARELLALLLALLHGADDGRLRAALATVLVGVDADGIAALERDGELHRQWQLRAQHWRERLQRGGPLALVDELCAANAERLLGLLDGERRLTNYLQLGELLQQADARALGLHGLVDWLGRRIAEADPDDETQLLRLESDARRVQIVTLHKSKGLEYPLVFLPFVGIGGKSPDPGRACVAPTEQGTRALFWKPSPETPEWSAARAAWIQAQHAEDARLLYVGLTRAEHALWIAFGAFYNAPRSPLAAMLADPAALAAQPGIVLDERPLPATLPWLPPPGEGEPPPARVATRRLAPDWWVYSFTQLANADGGGDTLASATVESAGGHDEPAAPVALEDDFDPRFAGNRFGVVLHAALEHGDFAAWRGWRPGDAAPAAEAETIAAALREGGYAAEDLGDGAALLARLIGQTLTVALPEGVRLCDVPAVERRAEIEFQFALRATRVDALLRLLHAHGVVGDRHGFGLRQRLEGLMTGLIDLTYRHEGRWYVLDYKSNRLPAYDPPALAQAMRHSEYDLQALIYSLALHRWLRFRLGEDYDYARDFGGVRYLFCRGLDAARDPSPGVHAQRFDPALVHALDALFAGAELEPVSARERGRGEETSAPGAPSP
ncbi:UvrD-helicase domain-containing protein [Pseudomonas sp. Hp2]|uniref:UvrD-helicase domain-containing protein n=1 Tax=Pseudomonas sp. Hp2 TaxID=701189 RepID=UPI001129A9F4|nr:exodeoxyribonuclease V subunit beta [Pseudomonas sp. Hp2]